MTILGYMTAAASAVLFAAASPEARSDVACDAFPSAAAPALAAAASDDPVSDFTAMMASSRVSFDYTYVMKGGPVDVRGGGSIVLQGNSYYIEGDGIKVWCDGTAVRTLDVGANEAVIESPDSAGGFAADPILVLARCADFYTWDKAGVRSEFGGVQCRRFMLKSKEKMQFDEITLYLADGDRAGHSLVGAVLKADKTVVSFTVSSFRSGPLDPDAAFAPESFPEGCLVTDLR